MRSRCGRPSLISTAKTASAAERPARVRPPGSPFCSPPIHASSTSISPTSFVRFALDGRPPQLVKHHPGCLVSLHADLSLERECRETSGGSTCHYRRRAARCAPWTDRWACRTRDGKIAGTMGLRHSFYRHAAQWLGQGVTASRNLARWQGLIERASRSTRVPLVLGRRANDRARRKDRRQVVRGALWATGRRIGDLASAFRPGTGQLAA